ncbi:hypothetical protein MPSEU_000978100 [Mayamaea pseudoterrestris]|nr:hypothetical protein MPSEU_000978100 [Mayamaea pseudoterrestris]
MRASLLLSTKSICLLLPILTESARLSSTRNDRTNDIRNLSIDTQRSLQDGSIDACQSYLSMGYDCDCANFVNGTGRFECTRTCSGSLTNGVCEDAASDATKSNATSHYSWSTHCTTASVTTGSNSSATTPSTTFALTYCINTQSNETSVENQVTQMSNTCDVTIQDQACSSCVMGGCANGDSSQQVTSFDCTNLEFGLSGSKCSNDPVVNLSYAASNNVASNSINSESTLAPQASPSTDEPSPVAVLLPEVSPIVNDDKISYLIDLCDYYDEHTLACDCDSSTPRATKVSSSCVMRRSSCFTSNDASATPFCFNQTLEFQNDGGFTASECYYLDNPATEYCKVRVGTTPETTETCQLLVNGNVCNTCELGTCNGNNQPDAIVNFDCTNTEAGTSGSECSGNAIFPSLADMILPPSASIGDTAAASNVPVAAPYSTATENVPTILVDSSPTASVQEPTGFPPDPRNKPLVVTTFAPTKSGPSVETPTNAPVAPRSEPNADNVPTAAANTPTMTTRSPTTFQEPTDAASGNDAQEMDNGASSGAFQSCNAITLRKLAAVVSLVIAMIELL